MQQELSANEDPFRYLRRGLEQHRLHPHTYARYYTEYQRATRDLGGRLGLHVATDAQGWNYIDDVGRLAIPGRWERSLSPYDYVRFGDLEALRDGAEDEDGSDDAHDDATTRDGTGSEASSLASSRAQSEPTVDLRTGRL